jgi:hypothetical protein
LNDFCELADLLLPLECCLLGGFCYLLMVPFVAKQYFPTPVNKYESRKYKDGLSKCSYEREFRKWLIGIKLKFLSNLYATDLIIGIGSF